MKSRILLLCVALVMASCVGDKATNAPNPDLPFKPVNIPEHNEKPGYGVYLKSCYQCHQQADPSTLSVDKWKNTVPAMAEHAGITKEEGEQVLDYILYVKSQGVR